MAIPDTLSIPAGTSRVLIVDDLPNWLGALCDMLDPTLHEIETATNSDEAKAKLKQRAFHVVVANQRLADEDENIEGILLLDEIAKLRDGTKAIIMSEYPTVKMAKEVLRGRSAFDYILKYPEDGGPFKIREYRERVKEAAEEAMGARESEISKNLAVAALVVNLTYDQIAETLFFKNTIPPDASKSTEKVLSWLLYPLQPLAHQMGKAWLSEANQTCEFLCWSRNYGRAVLTRIGQKHWSLETKWKQFTEEHQYLVRKSGQHVSGPVVGISYIIDELMFDDFAMLVEEGEYGV